VTRKDLESLPGGDAQPLQYALAAQPGFVTDTFGFGMHVRGSDGAIQYLLDGVPLRAAPLGQFGAAGGFIPRRLVESMQVITGGYAAEYGAGLGAVVDITTRRAVETPMADIQTAFGTYSMVDLAVDYSQRIGPVGLLAGANFHRDDRGIDPPAVSPILHDATTGGSAFVRADHEVGSRGRLQLLASVDQRRFQIPIDPTLVPLSEAPPGAARGVDQYGNVPPPFVPYDANPIEDERTLLVMAPFTDREDGMELHVAPFFRESFSRLSCDPVGTLGPSADRGSTCSDVRRDELHAGGLLDVAWKGGEAHSWKSGMLVDLSDSRVDFASYTRLDSDPLAGPNSAKTVFGSDATHVALAGAYLQDRIAIGRLALVPGIRLDIERFDVGEGGDRSRLLVGPGVRLGASYSITPDLVVHGFAGYLWQPPSTLDGPVAARVLGLAPAGQPVSPDIQAEKDWTAEIGVSDRVAKPVTVTLTAWGRLADDQLDRVNVGSTNLVASYNFERGRALGTEASARLHAGSILDAFGNFGWQVAQGKGVSSERYLFTASELSVGGWVMLDHVQTWTANVGLDLHDERGDGHVSALVNYGSGMRTDPNSDQSVPEHTTLDITLRRRLRFGRTCPEIAIDVFNVFNDIYAYRIGTGYIGSAYGPLRRVDLRILVALGD
jgi:hypothetical protein